jgi:hypothetical protein
VSGSKCSQCTQWFRSIHCVTCDDLLPSLSALGTKPPGGGMDTFSTLKTYPMTHTPMMNMPLPMAFSQHGLRTHAYSSLVGATMMINGE